MMIHDKGLQGATGTRHRFVARRLWEQQPSDAWIRSHVRAEHDVNRNLDDCPDAVADGTAGSADAGTHPGTGKHAATEHLVAQSLAAHPSARVADHAREQGIWRDARVLCCRLYLCSLASQYMSATAWYSVGHPSLPNYLAVTSGSTKGCSGDTCSVGISATDLGGQLTTAGIPWQAYMELMPSACDDIASNGAYTRVHNPFAYFTDNASSCRDVPYPGAGGLLAALDGSAAPDFVWISPNLNDDMHNGSVEQGDAWLRANLAPVLDSTWFTRARATVIVTMDENDMQPAPAGGQIPFVVISSTARGAGALTTHGNLYGTLRSIEETFGLRLRGPRKSRVTETSSGTSADRVLLERRHARGAAREISSELSWARLAMFRRRTLTGRTGLSACLRHGLAEGCADKSR